MTLNPDQLDRDYKDLINAAQRAVNTFNDLRLDKPKDVASRVQADLKGHRPYVPMVAYLCTEGLKEWHWEEIFELIGFEQSYRDELLLANPGKSEFKDCIKI